MRNTIPPVELPTTFQLLTRLAASAVGLFGAAWFTATGLAIALFPGGDKSHDELLSAVALYAPMSLLVLALAAWRELRWLPHLRASLLARRNNASSPAPATRPLLATFGAPSRVMITTLLGVMALLCLDALGLLSETRTASLRLPFDLLAFGVFQLAIHGAVLIWRRQLWPWLGVLTAADLNVPMAGSMAMRVTLRYISTAGFIGAALMAVLLAHVMPAAQSAAPGAADEATMLVGAAIVVVVAQLLAVGVFSARLARFAAADARRIQKEVDALAAEEEWSMKSLPEDNERLTTRHAQELRRRIQGLAERFSALAGAEAEGRAASEETQRLKTRFMAYMSHDLRSPLNSIKGFTEILARGADGSLNRDQLESVEAIQEGGDDLLRLVNDIVDSARLEAGRLELYRQWTPMVTIVAEVIGRARLLVRGRPLEFVSELEPGLPAAHVDRDRLAQAITNVLAHTLRLIDRGTLTIAVRSVQGPGPTQQIRIDLVASEPLPTREEGPIFRAFEGVKAKSGRRVGGLGLGLSLARALLVLHDGDLWYEGKVEARGARFCFAVPVRHIAD